MEMGGSMIRAIRMAGGKMESKQSACMFGKF